VVAFKEALAGLKARRSECQFIWIVPDFNPRDRIISLCFGRPVRNICVSEMISAAQPAIKRDIVDQAQVSFPLGRKRF
jgi:hypothetical protein